MTPMSKAYMHLDDCVPFAPAFGAALGKLSSQQRQISLECDDYCPYDDDSNRGHR